MIATVLWAFGLVLIVEGLAFALAPSRIEDVLKMLAQLTVTQKRSIGGIAVSLGVVLVLAAQVLN
ncbi:DUF2065 domain-containing protein [Cognatishimia maritima]|uniref:DUF2065 domain-containing protein n=1 Tax=Cognatishimia maritima TaxID=870908 RepID=A0A1M5KTI4_9RHOB|nr:DUF2065 domain-containing protein [Cognatishimia maritima]SHG56055.1 hypothetical protein SAMN04488044_1069 [Cognatishimia maritima]